MHALSVRSAVAVQATKDCEKPARRSRRTRQLSLPAVRWPDKNAKVVSLLGLRDLLLQQRRQFLRYVGDALEGEQHVE